MDREKDVGGDTTINNNNKKAVNTRNQHKIPNIMFCSSGPVVWKREIES